MEQLKICSPYVRQTRPLCCWVLWLRCAGGVGSVGKSVGSVDKSVGSVGKSVGSVGKSVGSAGKSVGSVGKSVGSVDKSVGSADKSVGSADQSVGSVDKSAGISPLHTLRNALKISRVQTKSAECRQIAQKVL